MNAKPIVRPPNVFALALIALLVGTSGPAASIPLPVPDFPLALSGDQVGLRSSYTAFASAFGDHDGAADSLTKFPPNWQDSISHSGLFAAVGKDSAVSIASLQGSTQVGRLKVKTSALVEGGLGSAGVFMTMQFMDVLQVDTEGVLHLNWVVSGTADQQILSPNNQAGSTLTAELYVWPFGALPTPGFAFNFTNYAKSVITGESNYHLLPNIYTYPAGSRWWVFGQLNLDSNADADSRLRLLPPNRVQTTADFGQTVELFITPDAATPDASFHSASGYDYRPAAIPEPASGLLLLAGLLALRLIAPRCA